LNNIRAQYIVCLQPNGNDNQVRSYPTKVKKYVSHRGRKFQGKSHINDGMSDRERQYSTAKYVGCKFVVKVIYPDEVSRDIEIHVNEVHTGQEPGSRTNCYFLPVH